jgi:hypothetical protein
VPVPLPVALPPLVLEPEPDLGAVVAGVVVVVVAPVVVTAGGVLVTGMGCVVAAVGAGVTAGAVLLARDESTVV